MKQSPKRPKPKVKLTDKEQYARFKETARELGVDGTGTRFKAAVEKILQAKSKPG